MENLNSVCYINRINKIEPIAGADKIELATVNGWTSVTQKGIHKEGDLVLCITTDAVIPESLATIWGCVNYLRNKSRVRTVKLKGVYSECILIPLIDLNYFDNFIKLKEGNDMMQALHIFKYEPPIREVQLSGGKKIKYKENPNFEVYYKFPNQKNVPNMFNNEDIVTITRKMHGSNARYGIVKKNKITILDKIKKFFGNKWVEYEYIYGSHHIQKGSDSQGFYSTDIWEEVAKKLKIKEKLWIWVKEIYDPKTLNQGIVLYGEIVGSGVQGEKYTYNLKDREFVGFDIQLKGDYLPQITKENLFKNLGLSEVPKLYEGPWSKEVQNSFVFNQFIHNTKIPEEGVVVSCVTGDRKKISKVINPDYFTYSEKNNVPDSH